MVEWKARSCLVVVVGVVLMGAVVLQTAFVKKVPRMLMTELMTFAQLVIDLVLPV